MSIECAFSGRLGRDAELRQVKNGTVPMLSFTVALDDGPRADGAPTVWIRVASFGAEAEALAPQLVRGARVYVEGKLKLDAWRGKDGAEHHGLSVVATILRPTHQIGRRRPKQSERTAKSSPSPAGAVADDHDVLDDPLPW